ncbi:ribonuclease H-like domain-containing protein [Desarmillaria tabescens]|uniref:Ribonuclease H-like domain-containing protein n=1 Tax=Armillaria tabescens TaxID=1929756 RepID=A0AA39J6V1_ARMTA|nr:ribonuclease H-like domain-containing protein [Desarmillaria tabescens]KAK0437138.1 ribonuclease H-like domain-containing protein [Desarmillaria tabescens]
MATNFEELNTNIPRAALKATRNAALLPPDLAFHKSMDPSFAKDIDVFSSKVLFLTNRLLELAATIDTPGKGKGKVRSEDDILDSFETLIVDRMDQLLERVDTSLDEYQGKTKPPAIAINPSVGLSSIKQKKKSSGQPAPVIQHAANLAKPQLKFKVLVDNSNTPWYPRLKHKYHAKFPLGYKFLDQVSDASDSASTLSTHPYRYEITHLSYPLHMFHQAPPIRPKPFETSSFSWVSAPEELQTMLGKLRQVTEIAVDLEHHSYRTYAGFLCLMQISTREEDWIIDVLSLRDELEVLNEVFADPGIIKVFHGADSDIVWLQQDLNLYIVNLFDTYHASQILSFPKHGLANLLEMYCDFLPDKRYQLADWRIRPLPEEMLKYARSDTHFLLFIYDNLRNALLDRGESQARSQALEGGPSSSPLSSDSLLREVLARSQETALKVYEKELYDAAEGTGSTGWDTLARKWNKGALLASAPNVGVGALPKQVYKGVHAWRDKVAREEDESTRYLLPNHFLFQLAENPPADMAALLRVFHSPPPLMKKRARELLDTIRDAVKAHLSRSVSASSIPEPQPEPMEVEHVDEDVVAPETQPTPSSTLWSGSTAASSLASKSSLFGTALPKTSALFGKMARTSNTNQSSDTSRFRELVTRIHSTLSIAPSVPKRVSIEPQENAIPMQVDETAEDGIVEMQAEIPFIPASQRQPREQIEDTLVVVGQARQKKRKRAAPADTDDGTTGTEATSSKKSKSGEGESAVQDPEPFDFSSVPNVLDQVPEIHGDNKVKKKGKQKKAGGASYFYGDFPAPPKGHSEVKSGNQSHTFQK